LFLTAGQLDFSFFLLFVTNIHVFELRSLVAILLYVQCVLYQGDLVKMSKRMRGRKAAKPYPEVTSDVALPVGEPSTDARPPEPIYELNVEHLNVMKEQLTVREQELETTLKLVKEKKITRAELQVLMVQGQQLNLILIFLLYFTHTVNLQAAPTPPVPSSWATPHNRALCDLRASLTKGAKLCSNIPH
jgi:hypothetical protein